MLRQIRDRERGRGKERKLIQKKFKIGGHITGSLEGEEAIQGVQPLATV